MQALSASHFKATCLDIFDQVAAGTLDGVVITKHGRPVGVLHPPPSTDPGAVFGSMRGTVLMPASLDLTEPAALDAFDAESGLLHR